MRRTVITSCKVLLFSYLLLASLGCQSRTVNEPREQHSEEQHSAEEHEADFPRGVHGGHLFEEKGFQLEFSLREAGGTAFFQAYAYVEDRQLVLSENNVTVSVETTRLGGSTERFELTPVGNMFSSGGAVREPHSFDVKIEARFNGQQYQWEYESYEGRVTLTPEVVENSGIKVEQASSRVMAETIKVRGKITPSEHRIAHIIPRFSGIVREARKHIGDAVEKGEVLAVIESNQSLQPYEVRSQIAGKVISGHLIIGEFIPENQWVYVVADFSEVWVDFWIPSRQKNLVRENQKVVVIPSDGDSVVTGKVSFVAPYAEEMSQSRMIRVILPNPETYLLPGMYVTGEVTILETEVPVAVKTTAIQSLRDWKVVFVEYGNVFEARPVGLGRTDGEWVEVISGLDAGTPYATDNSFLLKADLLKSGTDHEH